jgi:hypothetical protein
MLLRVRVAVPCCCCKCYCASARCEAALLAGDGAAGKHRLHGLEGHTGMKLANRSIVLCSTLGLNQGHILEPVGAHHSTNTAASPWQIGSSA